MPMSKPHGIVVPIVVGRIGIRGGGPTGAMLADDRSHTLLRRAIIRAAEVGKDAFRPTDAEVARYLREILDLYMEADRKFYKSRSDEVGHVYEIHLGGETFLLMSESTARYF